MKKIALVALAAAGLLVTAGAAQAKEVMGLKVCGASGCAQADPDTLHGWWGSSEPEQVSSTSPADYYNVQLAIGDGGTVRATEPAFYLPGLDLMRFRETESESWWKLLPNQSDVMRSLVGDVDAFTPELTSVIVKGKKVTDPNSYLRLFGKLPWAYSYPKDPGVKIVVRSPRANPWMDRLERMSYVPKRRILVRHDGAFRLTKAMGRRIMHRASLATSASASRGGHTALYAGIGIAGIAAVGLLLGAARRKARDS
jgi:hypothetical protein